jgi:hypothetical protein
MGFHCESTLKLVTSRLLKELLKFNFFPLRFLHEQNSIRTCVHKLIPNKEYRLTCGRLHTNWTSSTYNTQGLSYNRAQLIRDERTGLVTQLQKVAWNGNIPKLTTEEQKYEDRILHRVLFLEWARGLRRRSAAAWLLGSRVRIPLGTWIFICCVVLCRSLRRADHSFRGVLPCVCMCVIKISLKGRPKVHPGL